MPRKPKQPANPVKIEAIASAKLSAGYSVQKKVTETVPEDVTRAKASSWLDLISPLTEWAGLTGDSLRYKRNILRLQREETLTRIGQIVRDKGPMISIGEKIPTKFIVNFLEKASLEAPDDEIVGLWANLLTSAAENYNPHQVHFINVIAQMSLSQAKAFDSLVGCKSDYELALACEFIETCLQESKIEKYIKDNVGAAINNYRKGHFSVEKIISKLSIDVARWFNRAGVEFVYGDLTRTSDKSSYFEMDSEWSSYSDELEIDYEILVALGLARHVDKRFIEANDFEFGFKYYYITPLGRSFAIACKIVE